MHIKLNIFNSILIFVSNIWGWKHISGKCVEPNIFHSGGVYCKTAVSNLFGRFNEGRIDENQSTNSF